MVLFAFALRITPPLGPADLDAIRASIEAQGARARAIDRQWAGRVVEEPDGIRLLVVSDASDPDDPIHLELEAELLRRDLTFSISAPMPVAGPGAGAD
jgi:hypothetical protein